MGERDGFLISPLRRSTRTFPTRTALDDASDATRNQPRSFKGRRNQKEPSVPYNDARILPFAFKTVVRRIINAQEKGNDRHWRRMKSVGRRKHRPDSKTLRTVDSCLRHRSLEKVHQMCLEMNARIARNDPSKGKTANKPIEDLICRVAQRKDNPDFIARGGFGSSSSKDKEQSPIGTPFARDEDPQVHAPWTNEHHSEVLWKFE